VGRKNILSPPTSPPSFVMHCIVTSTHWGWDRRFVACHILPYSSTCYVRDMQIRNMDDQKAAVCCFTKSVEQCYPRKQLSLYLHYAFKHLRMCLIKYTWCLPTCAGSGGTAVHFLWGHTVFVDYMLPSSTAQWRRETASATFQRLYEVVARVGSNNTILECGWRELQCVNQLEDNTGRISNGMHSWLWDCSLIPSFHSKQVTSHPNGMLSEPDKKWSIYKE